MLIVELIGGLGNQMFQYAFGLSTSVQLRVPVKFDVQNLLDRTPRENFTFRDFELGIFEGKLTLATKADTLLFTSFPEEYFPRLYYRIQRKLKNARRYQERQHAVYDSEVLRVGSNTYFEGYWQSEKYFKPCCETLIREAFTFKPPLLGPNRILADQILATNAVAMHVRRGDYVTNSLTNEVHGTCSPAYYQQALASVQERVGEVSLFIFSDEPEWVHQNMHFSVPTTYISHNQGSASYEDMRLMSLCQHNIIANSSFSWWGAWLNGNPNKVVVAPQQWNQVTSTDTTDLIPSGWIRL